MRKIATILVYVDENAKADTSNAGSGLTTHGDDNYVLTINPNEHASYWFSGVTAPVMQKMKTIIAHELGHLLGFLCGDKHHSKMKTVVNAPPSYAVDVIRANQIGMEYEAWKNAYMVAGEQPLLKQIEEQALKSYKNSSMNLFDPQHI